ncbi:MAG: 2-octaprenyl-6-methoxyphenyl hydroxylase [Thiolinea sp.]
MYDVIIAGGGMVGASLAVALSPLNLRIALVEAFAFNSGHSQPAYDDRSVALSYGSGLIYQELGLWSTLQDHAEPIKTIHVSDKGFFGASRLHAKQEKVPALGYVIESRILGGSLYAALQASNVEVMAPAKVLQAEQAITGSDDINSTGSVHIRLDNNGEKQSLDTRLLIVADGADSPLRRQLGIDTHEYHYQQSAIIANVTTAKPHNNVAYERFTRSGPLALLPLSRNRYSLVWTRRADETEATLQLGDTEFLQQLQSAFGYRQGRFIKTGRRSTYPLKLVKSQQENRGRAVVIGNASHTLHPVAGQGLNLALRDVAVMAELLRKAVNSGADIGSADLLDEYTRLRATDYQRVVNYTDGLVKLFSSDIPGLGHLRAGGLLAVDRIEALRKQLAKQSMGLRYKRA